MNTDHIAMVDSRRMSGADLAKIGHAHEGRSGRCIKRRAGALCDPPITQAQADVLEAIQNIPNGDPDRAHSELDRLLLEAVHPRIREAAQALEESCAWWATA